MKSLLISGTYFPPQTGGISRMMEQICLALGPDRVVCLTGVRENAQDLRRLGRIKVYRRPLAFAQNKIIQGATLAFTFLEIILRYRPRVLQLASCQEGHLVLFLRRWFDVPFVIYAHGNEVLEAMHSKWEKPRLALKQASFVLANSKYTANLVQAMGVRPEAIKVIPLGCDIEKFQPLALDAKLRERLVGDRTAGPIVLTVGNLVERKGHDMIIRALPAISKEVPGVTYVIVGDGPYRKNLERLASSLGVGNHIVFAGRVTDEDLPKFYALSDVFAMPSRMRPGSNDVEGFGIVFLEASASGKPVVAGRSGGMEDAVLHGITGLLVDPADEEDIARTLVDLLTDDELRARLGKQGRDRVQKEYTWDIVGACVQAILAQAASERPRR
jgi:phosphatidylinositol alpha-1,6-mannosyltransferase